MYAMTPSWLTSSGKSRSWSWSCSRSKRKFMKSYESKPEEEKADVRNDPKLAE
jgi:hypothetical protein